MRSCAATSPGGYADRVVALRRKYPLVSFKPHLWVEAE
jgi:hypothetical protein